MWLSPYNNTGYWTPVSSKMYSRWNNFYFPCLNSIFRVEINVLALINGQDNLLCWYLLIYILHWNNYFALQIIIQRLCCQVREGGEVQMHRQDEGEGVDLQRLCGRSAQEGERGEIPPEREGMYPGQVCCSTYCNQWEWFWTLIKYIINLQEWIRYFSKHRVFQKKWLQRPSPLSKCLIRKVFSVWRWTCFWYKEL